MGPVDYLKGDGPNQQVRAAASVSDILFSNFVNIINQG